MGEESYEDIDFDEVEVSDYSYIPSPISKFYDFLRYDLIYGIQNFWKFKGIIFKDRWFDYSYIINLLVFKLEDMEKHWVEDTHHECDKFTKLRMQIIIKNIKTYEEDLDKLMYDYIVKKSYTKEEYKQLRNKIMDKSFGRLSRNIPRFWD